MSTQTMVVPFGSQNSVLNLRLWVKVKFFPDNSNLTNLVDVQSLHGNDKCVSDGIHTLFKNTF